MEDFSHKHERLFILREALFKTKKRMVYFYLILLVFYIITIPVTKKWWLILLKIFMIFWCALMIGFSSAHAQVVDSFQRNSIWYYTHDTPNKYIRYFYPEKKIDCGKFDSFIVDRIETDRCSPKDCQTLFSNNGLWIDIRNTDFKKLRLRNGIRVKYNDCYVYSNNKSAPVQRKDNGQIIFLQSSVIISGQYQTGRK